jgi:hypothetical protein
MAIRYVPIPVAFRRQAISVPEDAGSTELVGLVSGGPRVVDQYCRELRALGIEPVVSEYQGAPSDPPRLGIDVYQRDYERATEWRFASMSPESMRASDEDSREHGERRRRERPSVETWVDDIGVEAFRSLLAALMTVDQAGAIRSVRVDDSWSWRAVARYCDSEFAASWNIGWTFAESQDVGVAICEVAASQCGEDGFAVPWN